MPSLMDTIKAITLGQMLVCASVLAPVGGGALWGLDVMIKQAVAGEKFATQEALDEQKALLEKLQEQMVVQSREQAIVQTDLGTVKQLQKQTLDAILQRNGN